MHFAFALDIQYAVQDGYWNCFKSIQLKGRNAVYKLVILVTAKIGKELGLSDDIFAGGASIFFAKSPGPHAVLNDLDDELMNCYRQIRDNVGGLIDLLV